jgi:hypothetical protein
LKLRPHASRIEILPREIYLSFRMEKGVVLDPGGAAVSSQRRAKAAAFR